MDWFWVWVVVFFLALTLEIITEQLVPVWLMPGAVVAAILDLLSVPPIWQAVAFLLLAAFGIIFMRPMVKKHKSDSDDERELDTVVGEKCIVTERIDTFAGCGQAKVRGQLWSARGLFEDDVFEAGEVLQIVGLEGVKLICKKN